MKTLVVYYSLEGNSKLIAESVAGLLKADLLALKPNAEIPATGFRRFLWGLFRWFFLRLLRLFLWHHRDGDLLELLAQNPFKSRKEDQPANDQCVDYERNRRAEL